MEGHCGQPQAPTLMVSRLGLLLLEAVCDLLPGETAHIRLAVADIPGRPVDVRGFLALQDERNARLHGSFGGCLRRRRIDHRGDDRIDLLGDAVLDRARLASGIVLRVDRDGGDAASGSGLLVLLQERREILDLGRRHDRADRELGILGEGGRHGRGDRENGEADGRGAEACSIGLRVAGSLGPPWMMVEARLCVRACIHGGAGLIDACLFTRTSRRRRQVHSGAIRYADICTPRKGACEWVGSPLEIARDLEHALGRSPRDARPAIECTVCSGGLTPARPATSKMVAACRFSRSFACPEMLAPKLSTQRTPAEIDQRLTSRALGFADRLRVR